MSDLALAAAESQSDGGERLHELLTFAKLDERPHFSLTKHRAA
ncbi:MAG TPA: hypothetical protein VM580_28680 [Labilithrix sp.]|jgi:hypothetical protein|nr:hypothetical protein [Labilithrix sp.]